jgi:quinone-modifying oxidoreductase subunit QmoB
VRAIPVRCLGSVNTIWITDALNSGYDGVMMMGCKKGDDYQCHFVKGSEMAYYRMSKIDDTLKQLGLETERVQTLEVAITDIARVVKLINDYVDQIKEIGHEPHEGLRLTMKDLSPGPFPVERGDEGSAAARLPRKGLRE